MTKVDIEKEFLQCSSSAVITSCGLRDPGGDLLRHRSAERNAKRLRGLRMDVIQIKIKPKQNWTSSGLIVFDYIYENKLHDTPNF